MIESTRRIENRKQRLKRQKRKEKISSVKSLESVFFHRCLSFYYRRNYFI